MQPAAGSPSLWHALEIEEVFSSLEASPEGLSEAEAARRLAEKGPNVLQAARKISTWKIFLAQLKNVLIIILLLATVLSAFLGHTLEAAAIAVIVLFAVVLGFVQEYRAERAMEALQRMAAPTAMALRNGREIEVPTRDLVPGDVVLLRAGNRIPADARLFEVVNLQTEEAALTGESQPVPKQAAVLDDPEIPPGDRSNMVFAGTAATYGRGKAVVSATGMDTEFGRIAGLLETVERGKTPLQKNLDKVGRTLAQAALAMVAVIVVLGLWRGQPFFQMLLFGIALAVAVVPEALPAVVTISLAIGVQKMARRHALVRRLPAVETLGSVSVICTDKTGTLTRDEMTVRRILVAGRLLDVSGDGYGPEGGFSQDNNRVEPSAALRRMLIAAVLASDARVVPRETEEGWEVKGDPTEGALAVAAAKAGLDPDKLTSRFPRKGEIPFTSESKRMTTFLEGPEGPFACAKGAPEVIIEACSRKLTASGEAEFSAADREEILTAARRMAESALRVLAVADKPGTAGEKEEEEMVFLGLAGMIDPPRTEAENAIRICEKAGIRPVMITGDHPLTARAIARELGLLRSGRIVTGPELEKMAEPELVKEAAAIEVYARVSPVHKLRVVEALQKDGAIVAMTGDGVNDAPAVKKADIGVAMGLTGTDVTREAAAMTLTDDNFASIVAAVEEGRGIYSNIKKYLMYLLSSNLGEIGLIAGATLLGLPLPLTAVQVLYVNLATDGLPALALAVDPPEADLMRRPPRDPHRGIFTRPVVSLIAAGGLWSTAVNLGLFSWARESGRSTAEAMTMTFVSLILIQFFKAYNFRSDRRSVLDCPFANKWLNLAVGWEVLLLLLIVYLPVLHRPFGTYSLPPVDWVIVLVLAFSVSPVLELAKWMERRGWLGRTG
jgi:Ca2+-transporting ATPase